MWRNRRSSLVPIYVVKRKGRPLNNQSGGFLARGALGIEPAFDRARFDLKQRGGFIDPQFGDVFLQFHTSYYPRTVFLCKSFLSTNRLETNAMPSSSVHVVDYAKEIGRRIRSARDNLKLTLVDLSAATNGLLSTTRINNYERGKRTPGPGEAILLARALAVASPAYLMCLEKGDSMFLQEAELIHSWRQLPENERNKYVRSIKALALAFKDIPPESPKPAKRTETVKKKSGRIKQL